MIPTMPWQLPVMRMVTPHLTDDVSPHRQELLPPPRTQRRRVEFEERTQRLLDGNTNTRDHRLRRAMRAAQRLRNNRVHQIEAAQVIGGEAQRLGGQRRGGGVAP